MKELFNTYLWNGTYQRWTLICIVQFLTHIMLLTIFSKWDNPSWTFYLWGAALVIFVVLTVRSIRKKDFEAYFDMLNEYPDTQNRVYTFTCQNCDAKIKTLAVANGTVPETMKCTKCTGEARGVNLDINPDAFPIVEWIRPDWQAFSVMKDKSMKEYILNGGLLSKKLNL